MHSSSSNDTRKYSCQNTHHGFIISYRVATCLGYMQYWICGFVAPCMCTATTGPTPRRVFRARTSTLRPFNKPISDDVCRMWRTDKNPSTGEADIDFRCFQLVKQSENRAASMNRWLGLPREAFRDVIGAAVWWRHNAALYCANTWYYSHATNLLGFFPTNHS